MATLEELQARIQRLDDIKQVERLQRIYGYYRDYSEWMFRKLHFFLNFRTPHEDGWLNLPLMGWMPVPDADAPPTAFHPYPDFRNNVPYHYKHPVTDE